MTSPVADSPMQRQGSLAQRVGDRLRSQIAHAAPGDKLPSMRMLVRQLGVSINTVGSALDLLAAEGLVEKRHGSGVFVAQPQAPQPHRIGILSELNLFDPRIGPYFQRLADAVKRRLIAQGFDPHLYVGDFEPGPASLHDDPTCPRFWTDAEAGLIDGGVILNMPWLKQWKQRAAASPIPLVGASTSFETQVDISALIQAGVAQLALDGATCIGLIGPDGGQTFSGIAQQHGLHVEPHWIQNAADPAVRGSGYYAFQAIFQSNGPKPDALVISDEMLFADAQLAIVEQGIRATDDLQLAVQVTHGTAPTSPFNFVGLVIDPRDEADVLVDLLACRLKGMHVEPGPNELPFSIATVRAGLSSVAPHATSPAGALAT